ncbi:hypothetical protein C0995_012091 [Termitomyces sp. Mi166|nr:hypothetical protein C0995_012091 [Termitomyces sp. Mi166\
MHGASSSSRSTTASSAPQNQYLLAILPYGTLLHVHQLHLAQSQQQASSSHDSDDKLPDIPYMFQEHQRTPASFPLDVPTPPAPSTSPVTFLHRGPLPFTARSPSPLSRMSAPTQNINVTTVHVSEPTQASYASATMQMRLATPSSTSTLQSRYYPMHANASAWRSYIQLKLFVMEEV